jgi:hypothetical protein
MSYSGRRPKAEGRERLTSIAASEVRDVESANETGEGVHPSLTSSYSMLKPCSRWPDTTVVDQSSARARTQQTTDSEMFFANIVDEDCDSDTSTPATNQHMQRGKGDPEKGLGGVAPFIERNPGPDKMASTLEWRGRVLRSQEATGIQAPTSSRQQHTAEERRCASLEELEIERIRRHYQKQERILEEEIEKHEKRYKEATEQLKREDKDKVVYSTDWWPVRPDYQPTECSDDGSR